MHSKCKTQAHWITRQYVAKLIEFWSCWHMCAGNIYPTLPPIRLHTAQSLAAEWQRIVMQLPLAFAALCKNTTLIIHMCMWQEELLREYKGHKWKHKIILVVPHCQAHVCLFKILTILYGLYLHIWCFTMFKYILQIPLHNQILSQPVYQRMLSAIIYIWNTFGTIWTPCNGGRLRCTWYFK